MTLNLNQLSIFFAFGKHSMFSEAADNLFLSQPTLIEQKTLYIQPGSPWENGYIKSFSGKLKDELLNLEFFTTLFEAQVLIEN